MRLVYPTSIAILIFLCLRIGGCTPHSDPLKNWQKLGNLARVEIPQPSKQDAYAFFQTLPKEERPVLPEDEDNTALTYWEDGTGQHAVVFKAEKRGEYWRYALIYDRDGKRIKVLKYSIGSYMS